MIDPVEQLVTAIRASIEDQTFQKLTLGKLENELSSVRHVYVRLIDLKTGAERRLTQLNAEFDIRDFDLSGDKSEILFDRVEESSTVALIERTS